MKTRIIHTMLCYAKSLQSCPTLCDLIHTAICKIDNQRWPTAWHGTLLNTLQSPVGEKNLKTNRYMYVLIAQLCPTLCNPMDRSPPGSVVHRILQVRILEQKREGKGF